MTFMKVLLKSIKATVLVNGVDLGFFINGG